MISRIDVEYLADPRIKIEDVTVLGEESSKGCNVSNPQDLTKIRATSGYDGFHLSSETITADTLDGGSAYYGDKGYPGYCSKELSNADGIVDEMLCLSVKHPSNIIPKHLTIHFDEVAKSFVKDMRLSTFTNSNVIDITDNESYRCYIDIENLQLSQDDILYIKFTKLNKTGENVKVNKIAFAFKTTYDDNIIKNFKCSEQLMDTTFNINPTVLEQYAEISFKDKYNEFKKLAREGSLRDGAEIVIYIDDKLLGTYVSDSWDMQGGTNDVKLNCTDPSKSFDYINIKNLEVKDRTLHDLLTIGFDLGSASWRYIDGETAEYCNDFVAHNSWVEESNLRKYFNKVCLIGLLRIYWCRDSFVIARCY